MGKPLKLSLDASFAVMWVDLRLQSRSQARGPQVVPHATKYAKHLVRYTLASKMRTESITVVDSTSSPSRIQEFTSRSEVQATWTRPLLSLSQLGPLAPQVGVVRTRILATVIILR